MSRQNAATGLYERSDFCLPCHQLPPRDALAGRPTAAGLAGSSVASHRRFCSAAKLARGGVSALALPRWASGSLGVGVRAGAAGARLALARAQASLAARQCERCHARQVREWDGSLHRAAASPGLLAQTEYELAADDRARCLACHAPLAEQARDAALRADGVSCAGCHVRGWVRRGPPAVAPTLLSRGTGSINPGWAGPTSNRAIECGHTCAAGLVGRT